MRRLYACGLYLLLPLILLRLYWKGRRLPAYRQRIAERFFLQRIKPSAVDIWLHAASLGEVIAATPLIEALLARQWRVLVTTMTPTGSEHITRRFNQRVMHQYIPYDLPWVQRRFFKVIRPQTGIIMETELWPNMIVAAHRAQVTLIQANARISDKAFSQYRRLSWFFRPILQHYTAILAQSELDAERFRALGAPSAIVRNIGNMKFDVQTPTHQNELCQALKQQWGKTRPILIAASTHDDEESQLLMRLPQLKTTIPNLLLLIAPRHPERFETAYALSVAQGFNTARRSQRQTITEANEVIILDSMGELFNFFAVSDYAFIGGSLVPIGGHNVLEPIAMAVPVFCGPHMQNSKAICETLVAAKAIYCATDANDLINAIITMHQQPEQREQQRMNATAVLTDNRGTVAKHVQYIERYMA